MKLSISAAECLGGEARNSPGKIENGLDLFEEAQAADRLTQPTDDEVFCFPFEVRQETWRIPPPEGN